MKKAILLATSLLLTTQSFATPGICYSCLGITDTNAPYTKISAEQLKSEIVKIPANQIGICYHASISVAVAEHALNSLQAKFLFDLLKTSGASAYSVKYQKVMGMTDESKLISKLDISTIKESGFLNFIDKNLKSPVHTAYVQVTNTGEVYLYNINNIPLESALLSGDSADTVVGSLTRHNLTNKIDKFNSWLDKGQGIYYQPFSEVSRNIAQMQAGR